MSCCLVKQCTGEVKLSNLISCQQIRETYIQKWPKIYPHSCRRPRPSCRKRCSNAVVTVRDRLELQIVVIIESYMVALETVRSSIKSAIYGHL